jgi:hypoxanthine phosphoribosyltransferase
MQQITIQDKVFRPYLNEEVIMEVVSRLSTSLSKDYAGKNPLFLVVLNGSFIFAADLLRKMTIECELSFVKLSSYEGISSSGSIKQLIGLNEALTDRHIIVVEDIVDTGTTLAYLLQELNKRKVASVKIASLLFKPAAFKKSFVIDYIGLEIPNDFIVGYGLDYNGLGRNLKDIYVISED